MGFGRSKYVDKKYNANMNIIYSRNTYKSALQKSCFFLKYCKDKFSIRNLEDIRPHYFNEFIKDNGYKKSTANGYRWAITKLQNGYTSKHSVNLNWISIDNRTLSSANKEQVRGQMPREIHDKIIAQAYSNKYENGLAFDLARALGLRVSEITNLRKNDFVFDQSNGLKKVVIYMSKGRQTQNDTYIRTY